MRYIDDEDSDCDDDTMYEPTTGTIVNTRQNEPIAM